MNRYARIYRAFLKSSLTRELEFRANFLAKIVQNVMWIGFFVLILVVIFNNTQRIAGWNRNGAFVLAGTVAVMSSVSQSLFFSLTEIPEQVRRGTLDYVVTRPVDTQFWVSLRRFHFDQIGSIIAGAAMIAFGVRGQPVPISASAWLAYGALLVAAVGIFYSFNLALMTTGIWLVRVDNLWVLSDSVAQVARYPVDMYSSGIRRTLTYAFPLALLSTVPSRQLVSGFDARFLALGIVWCGIALFLARRFWGFAMRHYGSASS